MHQLPQTSGRILGFKLAKISGFDRRLAKARFATALPLAVAVIAFMLSLAFTLIYVYVADVRADKHSAEMADWLSRSVAVEVARGDSVGAASKLAELAPNRAMLLDANGDWIAGPDRPEFARRGLATPVMFAGETVGQLVTVDLVTDGPPMPLPTMLAAILCITGLAFFVANYFAQRTSLQIGIIKESVKTLSRRDRSNADETPLFFEEFRSLRVEIVRNIRKLKGEISRLTNAAYTDERTGLGNSAMLVRELTSFASVASFEEPACYILFDADGMQQMSEAYDSATSHELCAAISRRLANAITAQEHNLSLPPGSWPVFALQSDEFAVIVDHIGARSDIMRLVRKILDVLKEPYSISGKVIRMPVSAGVVMIPEDGQSPQDIRKRAESALFLARRKDNPDFQFYSPKLDRQSAARKRLEAEVRAAVENKRFVPVFQPKIDLQTGRIIGAEALARWKLESGRIVSPNVFIPVAESTGLISEIGTQITRQACRAAARWHRLGFRDASVAVNVSPLQFETDDLGTMIINAMTEAGLPPKLLQLEITESVAVTDPDRLRDVIGPLKTMGVRLAIDDFGTGHSNLAMLGRLPFDVFKIDRQFISGLYTDKQAPAIVEMILGMAETLGMETVAEGVETEAQEKFLRQRGCDQYQGFLFSPPVSLDRFIEMLGQDKTRAISEVS